MPFELALFGFLGLFDLCFLGMFSFFYIQESLFFFKKPQCQTNGEKWQMPLGPQDQHPCSRTQG
jgi:hypothetical protein